MGNQAQPGQEGQATGLTTVRVAQVPAQQPKLNQTALPSGRWAGLESQLQAVMPIAENQEKHKNKLRIRSKFWIADGNP